MDDALLYLFAAFFVTWLILGGYLLSLRRQVENVRTEVEALRSEQRGTAAQRRAGEQVGDSPTRVISEERP